MRGRKPKPIELRVLHGKAAEQAAAEYPRPRRALPRCPEHLTGEAEKCWRRLSRDLYDAGLLTAVDRDALAAYCVAYARWRKAEAELATSDEVITTAVKTDEAGNTSGGNLVQNPWLAVSNRALLLMAKLAAEFGMTPSSRSRVKAEIAEARKAQAQARPRLELVKKQPVREAEADDPRSALG